MSKIDIQKLSMRIQIHTKMICMFLKIDSWAAQSLHTVFLVKFYFNYQSKWLIRKQLNACRSRIDVVYLRTCILNLNNKILFYFYYYFLTCVTS